ncbi:MAG: enoyl-CoA hydratase/isomerase family protein [Planctomycetota bacterium]|nr:enoyl-CoA hydratase/isomerase family protein [Planctomycetota bacterium]
MSERGETSRFASASGFVRLAVEARVASVTLARGEKRNALVPAMLDDVASAVRVAIRGGDAADIGAIVLHGEGPMFCSGFDLDVCHADASNSRRLLAGLSALVQLLRDESDVPVVIAAHGGAIAGGCAMLAGADVVVTDRAAKFGYPVTMLGLSPAVSAPSLRRMIDSGPTRSRMLQPTLVDGVEATKIGIAHECVATPAEVLPRARSIVEMLAAKPAGAARVTKAWLRQVEHRAGLSAAVMIAAGLETSLGVVGTQEERSLLAAFVNRSRSKGSA